MVLIRPFKESDWDAVWQLLEPVFRAGDTYPYPQDLTKEQAYQIWIATPKATFVAVNDDPDQSILGTYYIKPNQPGRGSHVCNCGYIVGTAARGKGIASKMCEHSQRVSVDEFGFRAMQYNFVVSTNQGAVRLWQKLGFETIGTIPKGFDHPEKGFVDALVMYKHLQS